MAQKILIVEDIDSISTGVKTWVADLFPGADIRSTKYCDEALMKVKRSVAEMAPFDLVISDLNFKEDFHGNKIADGEELVAEIKKVLPQVKIIIYSIDDRPYKIQSLLLNHNVNAFVAKSRDSYNELIKAINLIYTSDATYISPEVLSAMNKMESNDLEDEDIEILRLLSQGHTQASISNLFKQAAIYTGSTSSIEKRLNKLKASFKASNTLHLIVIAKDLGII